MLAGMICKDDIRQLRKKETHSRCRRKSRRWMSTRRRCSTCRSRSWVRWGSSCWSWCSCGSHTPAAACRAAPVRRG